MGYHLSLTDVAPPMCPNVAPMSVRLNLTTRKSLLFALTAERLSTFYEHGQWLTEAQGATLATSWLARHDLPLPHAERKAFSALSDTLARELAGSLSRAAGLYTAHEMMEALSPNYVSDIALDLMDECERRLREAELAE